MDHRRWTIVLFRKAIHLGLALAVCLAIAPAPAHSAAAQGNSRTINGHTVAGRFLEVGPGRVLSGLAKRTLRGVELVSA